MVDSAAERANNAAMVRWRSFLVATWILLAGCTLSVRNKSGQTTSYTWPAPAAQSPRYVASAPPGSPASPSFQYQQKDYSSPAYSGGARSPAPAGPSTDWQQPPAAAPSYAAPSRAPAVAQNQPGRDPLAALMTADRDTMDGALDLILQGYKRCYADRAAQPIGFRSVPQTAKYMVVTRTELPVLGEPNISADQLTLVGIARAGEYYPVLDEVETVYTLSNPLSRRPNNGGKWCKVQTSGGQIGWILAEPFGMGSKAFAQVVRAPPPPSASTATTDPGNAAPTLAMIVVLGTGIFLLVKLASSRGSGIATSSAGGGSYSGSQEASTAEGWFQGVFHGRTESQPKQRLLEGHGDYRRRVYLEGKERIIEDAAGAAPKQGFFEGDERYRSRVAHEANEAIVEKASGSEPKQRLFEADEKYRERVAHEANESIVEGATGSEPKQGFFEGDEHYHGRVAHEANEHIVEEASGSAPKQGFFEGDDHYATRISQEAKDIKASRKD